MSKFFHLTKNPIAKIRKTKKLGFISLRVLNGVILFLVILSGVTYLMQMNSLATRGYKIKELENKVAELKQNKADLGLEVLSLQSMDSIQSRVDGLGMVAISETDYLKPTPVAVAR